MPDVGTLSERESEEGHLSVIKASTEENLCISTHGIQLLRGPERVFDGKKTRDLIDINTQSSPDLWVGVLTDQHSKSLRL